MGDDRHFVFRQKLLGEDGSVRWGCHGEAARYVLAKVWGNVFAHFHAVAPQNVTVEPRIHILACWDKFFVHNPFDAKKSDDHALDIAFRLSGLFWPW